MKKFLIPLAVGLAVLFFALGTQAQRLTMLERLEVELLDVRIPAIRVNGPPGQMAVQSQACRNDIASADVRRRIVDIAVQEWAYFGFSVVDQTERGTLTAQANGFTAFATALPRRLARPSAAELIRTADSVAGYWAVTPDGAWILSRQNEAWNGNGGGSRWVDPWSAAFISWVMCEAGLTTNNDFQRAIAHHAYIDQAIRARDGQAPQAAFVAYDVGEQEVLPGDLLCAGQQPAYRNIAERRAQMGSGARSHCDIVVAVDEDRDIILAIGGNVRGTVGLKLLAATRHSNGYLATQAPPGQRQIFAHLRLRTDPIEADALYNSPTMRALRCAQGFAPPMQLLGAGLLPTAEADVLEC